MGEHDISSGILYASFDGESYQPLGEIQNFEMTSPEKNFEAFGNQFNDGFIKGINAYSELDISADLKVEHSNGKHQKRTFKKWLMSRGYSRDDADAVCWLIAKCRGEVSYEYVRMVTILTGEVPSYYISRIAIKHMIENATKYFKEITTDET